MGSERADAERQLRAIEADTERLADLSERARINEICKRVTSSPRRFLEDQRWLIAELRAAWAREDEAWEAAIISERGRVEAYEERGYRRGLAAARARLADWKEDNDKRRRFSMAESCVVEVAISLIDALAAGAGKEKDHD